MKSLVRIWLVGTIAMFAWLYCAAPVAFEVALYSLPITLVVTYCMAAVLRFALTK